jgi:hypothetical protein
MTAPVRIAAALFAVVALALLVLPARGHACSVSPTPHVLSPQMQATDHQPPTLATIVDVQVARGHAANDDGCSATASSCDDLGSITFSVAATDDMTPPAQIGYGFSLAGGTLPQGFVLPATALRAPSLIAVSLTWPDGATDVQDSLDFSLRVVAIDLAGNQSTPQTIRIQQAAAGGCRVAGGVEKNGNATALLTGVALVVLLGPRRRGRDRRLG